ncbi:MAG: TonB-dependent receptor [Bacteroidales bacterium]|nr:TonB-dependent receptor [Bacteroidales bacterium]
MGRAPTTKAVGSEYVTKVGTDGFSRRTTIKYPSVKALWLFIQLIILLLLLTGTISAQDAIFRGKVSDAQNREALPGVNILISDGNGRATDENGQFEIVLKEGQYTFTYKFIGYSDETITFFIKSGEVLEKQVRMQPRAFELNTAVVSASLYEQRLSDVTVSMEVIPAGFIENVITRKLDETISLVPGVDVMDGQANIRGGSGYSYGAGSRVMMLLDGLPLLTGDVNDIKWSTLPIENIGQVEIIKGASSALYGSSALNGVINLRTMSPGLQPMTTVDISAGMYLQPLRDELSWWWDHYPLMGNMKFSHLRKTGSFDISAGGSAYYDEGYRDKNQLYYGRLNAGIKFNPKKIKSLQTGFYTNFQFQDFSDFLIWQDADSGAFLQNPEAVSPNTGYRFNIDPFVRYYDKREGRHSLNTRYYKIENHFKDNPDKENGSDYFFGEYQYQREFSDKLHLAAGLASSYTIGTSELYGNHRGSTLALYSQADYKPLNRLSFSLGLRWEWYSIDHTDNGSSPVMRTGLNWQAARYTFLRASFGQGYRYPSMAEKYTSTSLGALRIFPNPDLEPETGWSTEIGLKQGLRIRKWNGYLDIAGFWTEYQHMMEFTFGIYKPDSVQIPTLEHLGFMSINTGDARIRGIDFSITGQGPAGKANIRFFAGYTYMDPVDLSADSTEQKILKYRYRHSAKGDISASLQKFSTGLTVSYQSFIERIDMAFEEKILGQEIFPGLKEYRQENDKGAVIIDWRFSWQVSSASRISIIIRNLTNKEHMGRPGDIQPPRNFTLQYLLNI